MQRQHPSTKVKYLAEYCFSGTYILTLLTEGYNFTADTFKEITIIRKVGGLSFLFLPSPPSVLLSPPSSFLPPPCAGNRNTFFLLQGQNKRLGFLLPLITAASNAGVFRLVVLYLALVPSIV
jgi:hypothetical protein